MRLESITVVAAVNSDEILRSNLLLSPLLAPGHRHQLLIREGFRSAALAYNDALRSAENEIVVFVHQDVYLPEHWLDDLQRTIAALDAQAIHWGVIGCFGSRADAPRGLGSVYSTGWGMQGQPIARPEPVDTLDEIVLVIRKSSGLQFDAALPHYHLYGADLCLTARARGMAVYAMPTLCVHNTRQLLELPPEFFACYRYIKRKWAHCLPIHTSCIRISRFDGHLMRKKLEKLAARLKGRSTVGAARLADPRSVLGPPSPHTLTEV